MRILKKIFRSFFILLILSNSYHVSAQFAGDVFFANPSIAVAEGEQGQIEVLTFMGTSTFGAIQFDLIFNPTLLNIISVSPGLTPELRKGFTVREQEGVVSIIALNGESADSPIGTVSLVLIEVAPLAAAGSVINVNINVETVLRQDSSAFSSPNGFGLEIVVTNPMSLASSATQPLADTVDAVIDDFNSEIYQRALALRPEGSAVTVMVLDANNNAFAKRVKTRSASASSD